MQNEHETLGEIIKNARMKADITVEDLATKVGVTERFIYRIENEGKKPSYDILYKLIRELSILPDQIFFPEKIRFSSQKSRLRILKWKALSVCCITATSVLCRSSRRQLGRPWTASPESEKEPMSVGNSHRFIGSASMRLAL